MKKNIQNEFVVLDHEKNATVELCDSSLYERIGQNYGEFIGHELISCHEFSEDWPSWEIHPHGDEVVILLSGKATLVLDLGNEQQQIELSEQGDYVLVPRDTWHTAKIKAQSKLLFITPGQGTLNKDV